MSTETKPTNPIDVKRYFDVWQFTGNGGSLKLSAPVVSAFDYDALAAIAAEHRDGRLAALERIVALEEEQETQQIHLDADLALLREWRQANKRLEAALRRYGEHHPTCGQAPHHKYDHGLDELVGNDPCTCGLDAALVIAKTLPDVAPGQCRHCGQFVNANGGPVGPHDCTSDRRPKETEVKS